MIKSSIFIWIFLDLNTSICSKMEENVRYTTHPWPIHNRCSYTMVFISLNITPSWIYSIKTLVHKANWYTGYGGIMGGQLPRESEHPLWIQNPTHLKSESWILPFLKFEIWVLLATSSWKGLAKVLCIQWHSQCIHRPYRLIVILGTSIEDPVF